MKFISDIIGSISGGVSKVAGTFLGNQQERDQQTHESFQTVQASYQAEYTNSSGFLNSVVDGVNRLVRPLFTYGVLSLFGWSVVDPEEFVVAMRALEAVPEPLWYILGAIITFWFGSKSLFKDLPKYKYKYKVPKVITRTISTHEVVTDDDTPIDQKLVVNRNVDNDVIRAWLKTQS